MEPRLTLTRVEQCLQQGKAEAVRLGVQAAIVVVDAAGHLMGALRFEDALWVTPEIARAKANTAVAFRASTAFRGRANARLLADLVEGASLLIGKDLGYAIVVGDEEVRPAVAVVVEHRHPERFTGFVPQSRLLADIFEFPAAEVVIELRLRALVRLRRAIGLRRAVQ